MILPVTHTSCTSDNLLYMYLEWSSVVTLGQDHRTPPPSFHLHNTESPQVRSMICPFSRNHRSLLHDLCVSSWVRRRQCSLCSHWPPLGGAFIARQRLGAPLLWVKLTSPGLWSCISWLAPVRQVPCLWLFLFAEHVLITDAILVAACPDPLPG